jgi:hypothetical protein
MVEGSSATGRGVKTRRFTPTIISQRTLLSASSRCRRADLGDDRVELISMKRV